MSEPRECSHSDSERVSSIIGQVFLERDDFGNPVLVTEEFAIYRCLVCGETYMNIEFIDEDGNWIGQ